MPSEAEIKKETPTLTPTMIVKEMQKLYGTGSSKCLSDVNANVSNLLAISEKDVDSNGEGHH